MYRLYKHVLIGPALRMLIELDVRDHDRVPDTGPVVLAANHLAEVDSLVLPLATARPIAFFAKSDYFDASGVRGALGRAFLASTGQIAVRRSGGDEGALRAAADRLRAGGVWGAYPEGTRSRDGLLHRGHTGLMRVAQRVAGTVVVPFGLVGTDLVDPPSGGRLRRGRVSVRFGEPVDAEGLLDEHGVRGATDEIMRRIALLSGRTASMSTHDKGTRNGSTHPACGVRRRETGAGDSLPENQN